MWPIPLPFHLKRMRRIARLGSWTITTLRRCGKCSRRSMVSISSYIYLQTQLMDGVCFHSLSCTYFDDLMDLHSSRTDDWLVSHRSQTTRVRPRDQRSIQAVHPSSRHGDRQCEPRSCGDPYFCLFCCRRNQRRKDFSLLRRQFCG